MRPTLAVAAVGLMVSSLWLVFLPIRAMREYPTPNEFLNSKSDPDSSQV